MKKLILAGSLGILSLAIVASVLYYKPHRRAVNEDGIPVSATDLFSAFAQDEASANTSYLDKVLSVQGRVASVATNQNGDQVVVLQTNDLIFGVSCTMEKPISITIGSDLKIKGFCKGYLSDVVMTNCSLE